MSFSHQVSRAGSSFFSSGPRFFTCNVLGLLVTGDNILAKFVTKLLNMVQNPHKDLNSVTFADLLSWSTACTM